MRLQTKLICITVIPLVLLLTLILIVTQLSQRSQALANAEVMAEKLVREEAAPMLATLDRAYTISQNLASMAGSFKMRGSTDRGQLIEMVRQIQLDNPDFLGTWLMFDPDALDGNDAAYRPENFVEYEAETEATGPETVVEEDGIPTYAPPKRTMQEMYGPRADYPPTGVASLEGIFNCYWVGKDDGKSVYASDATGNTGFEDDYYALPRDSGKTAFPEIYLEKEEQVLTSTVSTPVIADGSFIGVAGVDIGLNSVQEEISLIRPMETGHITVLSREGLVLAAPDPNLVGETMGTSFAPEIHQAVKNESRAVFIAPAAGGEEFLHLSLPLYYGEGGACWHFIVSLPLDKVMAASNSSMLQQMLLSVGGLIVVILLVFFLIRRLTRDILLGVDYANTIAAGNLDAKLDLERKDEIGTLATALKQMVKTIKDKIQEADDHTREAEKQAEAARLATEAAEMSAKEIETKQTAMLEIALAVEEVGRKLSEAVDDLSTHIEQATDGAELQQARVSETSVSMSEMNQATQEVARKATETSEISNQARAHAMEGAKIVAEVVESIRSVEQKTNDLKEAMASLGEQAQDIDQVMNVITDIADQTNLLALNAAIEAARAGDSGRGFAVVADEVRKLAEKTMEATKEVGSTISRIQQSVAGNIEVVGDTAGLITRTAELSLSSGEALKKIVDMISVASDEIQSIATAAEQQSASSETINQTFGEVAGISSQTAGVMEQSTTAVNGLAEQGRTLSSLIVRLKE